MPRNSTVPADRAAHLHSIIAAANALQVDFDLADLRAALAAVENLDPDLADLRPNVRATRTRLVADLAGGTVTLDQARAELSDATARAAVDTELADMLAEAQRHRVADAWSAAGAVDWHAAIGPAARDAAHDVAELAAGLPAGMSDTRAVHGTDKLRRSWLAFGTAVGRWQDAVGLLVALMRDGLADRGPIEPNEWDLVPLDEWSFDGAHGALMRDDRRGDLRDPGIVLADVAAGAEPGAPDPTEIVVRLNRRRDLREANVGLARMGWSVPGADVRPDVELPRKVADMVVKSVPARA